MLNPGGVAETNLRRPSGACVFPLYSFHGLAPVAKCPGPSGAKKLVALG